MQKTKIVIPCYNESARLNLNVFEHFLKQETEIDFLFVNDGSTDTTYELLQSFQQNHSNRVSVLNLKLNSGKAEAVRQGVIEACKCEEYEVVGFWDADLATPLSEIPHFLSMMKQQTCIALGSRMKRLGADIQRRRLRHLLGRVFSTFSSIILKLPVYDTQCGAKLFKTSLKGLFEDRFMTSWLFDIELLARYRNQFGVNKALETIIEVPVNTWAEVGGSKLKLKHMIKVPFELIRIHKKYNS